MFDGRFRTGVDRAVEPGRRRAAADRALARPSDRARAGAGRSRRRWAIGSGRLGLGPGPADRLRRARPARRRPGQGQRAGQVRGAFFDSVCDRVTDALVLGGVAWYLQDHHHGHAALLPFAVLGASLLISYERAKAESLGFDAKGGLMERAERIVVLCAGLAFSFLLVPLLWLMLA